jgi:LacI family transcriptional regulator
MRITSNELSKLCNVSRATVDRVLNNRGKVNDATRKKIIEMAKSVGYRPNYIAQSLATGRTLSIGLVVPSLDNYFFSVLLNSIAQKAQENNYTTLISLYEGSPDFEHECILSLIERQVDGIILFSTSNTDESAKLLKQNKIPTVLVLNELDGFPCVNIDFDQAMYDATNYVLSKGYQNLIFICPPLEYEKDMNIFAVKQKYNGFLKVLEMHQDQNISHTIIRSADYIAKINKINFRRDLKTAILCSSDIYTLKVMKSLKTKGIHIPLDVGIMGFDGIELLDYLEPSIATVDISISQMGEIATLYLLDIIKNGFSDIDIRVNYVIKPGQSII